MLMKFNSFPEIKTDRLYLRQLIVSDWEIISYLRSDKLVNTYVDRPKAETREDAVAFIDKINNGIKEGQWLYWGISLKDNPKLIGTICLWNFSENGRVAEVGYDLHPEFQGMGIMNEALKNIITYGFKNLDLDLIEAFTHKKNESSRRLLEKNNFGCNFDKVDEYNKNNEVYELKNDRISE